MSLLLLLLAASVLAAGLGALLARLDAAPAGDSRAALIDAIDACLPQTQCAQCGYPGCRPYAAAIATGDAPINRCPPGGEATIADLAALLGRPVIALDTQYGETRPAEVAFIRESECIGCALCLPACPVDAIVGAQRFTHTVVTDLCTGCALCLPPCPVDCIDMEPGRASDTAWQWPAPEYQP